jgi:hypothetical protein
MYSKQDASTLRQEFWTAFGMYMALHLSSERARINWSNYKTGIGSIRFKMNVDKQHASIGIWISDDPHHETIYHQFHQFKNLLEGFTGESWTWNHLKKNREGKVFSSIEISLPAINIFNKQDWPAIISFLKPRIIALDAFWNDIKPAFESMG